MKSIETYAYGCRFRSRLEARWAVFFTEAGIEWEYEPQGFETEAGPYLPDFRVRIPERLGMSERRGWVEVKPNDGSQMCPRFRAFALSLALRRAAGDYRTDVWHVRGDPLDKREEFTTHGGLILTQCRWMLYYGVPNSESAMLAARRARFEHGEYPCK